MIGVESQKAAQVEVVVQASRLELQMLSGDEAVD